MRMSQYFLFGSVAAILALLVAAGLGFSGDLSLHFKVALPAAILTVGAHTLLILFMMITGRILREAIRCRDLPQEFLDELNLFFSRKSAYPAAVIGCMSITAAAVLAFGAPVLGLPAATHWVAASLALLLNLWVLPVEYRALRETQLIVDKAAGALDKLDEEITSSGGDLPEDEGTTPEGLAQGAMAVAIGAWLPYIYMVFIMGEGDLSSTSIHPFIEVSIGGLVVWWLGRSEAKRQASESADASSST
jgi:hypothetical protein